MKISENCVVGIEYTLTEAGMSEVIDSNKGQAPLEFITGKQHIIPGLESQLMELSTGDSADLKVDADQAYGLLNEEAIDSVPKEQFADIDLEIGMQLFGQGENGEQIAVVVKELKDDVVVIDYNHPLAGKDLMFSVTVTDVRVATEAELATGQVGGGHDHGDGCCGSGSCDS